MDIEVFDEPTQFLSAEGIDDLLDNLRARAEAYNKSIYLCDHRALAYGSFVEVLGVTKTAEGSSIEVLAKEH